MMVEEEGVLEWEVALWLFVVLRLARRE